ncbi:MAG: ribonuclease H-like domain-containing protein [Anaerolineales bacterium]|nr:ribonuclease H-like domain-containing protein [Anaerolineales bacterium]
MGKKDPADLRRRLKKMGARKRSKVKTEPKAPIEIKYLPDGEEVETSFGAAYRIESQYENDYLHGRSKLSNVLSFPESLAADITRQPAFFDVPFEDVAYLDTETTGLGGGAGTLVFLVGIGSFVGNMFRLRQYFLRDPAEEAGMLDLLQNDLESASGFVTYNGAAFDLPLLESRYTIALRRRLSLTPSPHLDLLHVARRLWKRALPDCKLGTVEGEILGVQRTDDDVPGAWIPGMYLDYLRSGNAAEMNKVIYHNTVDVLSLVGLAGHVFDRYSDHKLDDLNDSETLAIARWHQDSGRSDTAESAYQKAAKSKNKDLQVEALRRYASHLKKEKRRQEAIDSWVKWHRISPGDPTPCIELAKYFEWDVGSIEQAHQWAQAALLCLTHWAADWRRDQLWAEIEHRIMRLKRKMDTGNK